MEYLPKCLIYKEGKMRKQMYDFIDFLYKTKKGNRAALKVFVTVELLILAEQIRLL